MTSPLLAPVVLALLLLASGSILEAQANGEKIEFNLKQAGGDYVSSKDFSGKIVLINFWATWCVPCIKEIPHLEKAYQEHKDKDFVVLGINYQQSEERVLRFLRKKPVSFPMLIDPKGEFSKLLGVRALPVSLLLEDGVVINRLTGSLSEAHLEAWLSQIGK